MAWDNRDMTSRERYARYAEIAQGRLEEKRRAELGPSPAMITAQSHAEREAYWLEQERQRYNLPRRGKPLSRMPA